MLAVLPELHLMRKAAHRKKKKKVLQVQLSNMLDLVQYTQPLLLPSLATNSWLQLSTNPDATEALALVQQKQYVVPMMAAQYDVQGALFTGPTQIRWIKQLLDMPGAYTPLHKYTSNIL